MVGFGNIFFRVKISTICIEPAFLIFKPNIDGECPWANEDTHKLFSLNARRTITATTAEHTLNAQQTPLDSHRIIWLQIVSVLPKHFLLVIQITLFVGTMMPLAISIWLITLIPM